MGLGLPPKLCSYWSSKKIIYFEKNNFDFSGLEGKKIFVATHFDNNKEFVSEFVYE
ncbi:MAG: hypothetical protein ACJ0GV_04255 [Dehalococcoidia bacterium]